MFNKYFKPKLTLRRLYIQITVHFFRSLHCWRARLLMMILQSWRKSYLGAHWYLFYLNIFGCLRFNVGGDGIFFFCFLFYFTSVPLECCFLAILYIFFIYFKIIVDHYILLVIGKQKGELPPGRAAVARNTAFPFQDSEIEKELNELRRKSKDF